MFYYSRACVQRSASIANHREIDVYEGRGVYPVAGHSTIDGILNTAQSLAPGGGQGVSYKRIHSGYIGRASFKYNAVAGAA